MTELMTEHGMVRVPAGVWTVDPAHSSAAFEVKRMMISTIRGHFREFDGRLEAAEDDPSHSREDPWGNERVGIRVRGTVSRTDFGLTWNQPLARGGMLVGETVSVLLDVSAVRT